MNAQPTMLLVDNEAAITDDLAPLLSRSGFAVAVAPDGVAALDAIAQSPVDLVVLDVMMPRMDGCETDCEYGVGFCFDRPYPLMPGRYRLFNVKRDNQVVLDNIEIEIGKAVTVRVR
jgi:hypothetical protein